MVLVALPLEIVKPGWSAPARLDSLSKSCSVIIINFVPVNYVEKCSHVVRSSILIEQVLGMLPDINSQYRFFT